jgi:hypothetical protein
METTTCEQLGFAGLLPQPVEVARGSSASARARRRCSVEQLGLTQLVREEVLASLDVLDRELLEAEAEHRLRYCFDVVYHERRAGERQPHLTYTESRMVRSLEEALVAADEALSANPGIVYADIFRPVTRDLCVRRTREPQNGVLIAAPQTDGVVDGQPRRRRVA